VFAPKDPWRFQRIDGEVFPPGYLIADLMDLAMMAAAERDRELIAHFQT
jgi:hypothetical protein